MFGPHPRSYEQRMPRKMRRLALKSALSVKASEQHVVVLDDLQMEAPKTKEMLAMLGRLAVEGTALILLPEERWTVQQSAHNLPEVKILRTASLNVADLLGHDYLIMPMAAVEAIHQHLSEPAPVAAGTTAE